MKKEKNYVTLEKLQEVRKAFEICESQNSKNNMQALDAFVKFFADVAKLYDRPRLEFKTGLFRRKYTFEQKQMLASINNGINKAGRDQFGINRTECGEIVTDKNVYFGDREGLFTKTISFWKQTEDRSAQDKIVFYALAFMRSYKGVLDEIDNLIKNINSVDA